VPNTSFIHHGFLRNHGSQRASSGMALRGELGGFLASGLFTGASAVGFAHMDRAWHAIIALFPRSPRDVRSRNCPENLLLADGPMLQTLAWCAGWSDDAPDSSIKGVCMNECLHSRHIHALACSAKSLDFQPTVSIRSCGDRG
jgi:hypothetical protein